MRRGLRQQRSRERFRNTLLPDLFGCFTCRALYGRNRAKKTCLTQPTLGVIIARSLAGAMTATTREENTFAITSPQFFPSFISLYRCLRRQKKRKGLDVQGKTQIRRRRFVCLFVFFFHIYFQFYTIRISLTEHRRACSRQCIDSTLIFFFHRSLIRKE